MPHGLVVSYGPAGMVGGFLVAHADTSIDFIDSRKILALLTRRPDQRGDRRPRVCTGFASAPAADLSSNDRRTKRPLCRVVCSIQALLPLSSTTRSWSSISSSPTWEQQGQHS